MNTLKSTHLVVLSAALAIVLSLVSDRIPGISAAHASGEPVTVVILAKPAADGAAARKEYSEKVNPLGDKAGVKVARFVKVNDQLVGEADYKAVVILEFPSRESAQHFFTSADYRALIPLRNKGYDQYDAVIGQ